MQWDVCITDSTLAAYIDNALSPHHNNGRSDDDLRMAAVGEERTTRRNTMPSIQMNRALFVKTSEVGWLSVCGSLSRLITHSRM